MGFEEVAHKEELDTEGSVVATIRVNETEYELDPDEIELNEAGIYLFLAENSGREVHALEIEGQGIEARTRDLQLGESAEFRVNLGPGRYELYYPVGNHEERHEGRG